MKTPPLTPYEIRCLDNSGFYYEKGDDYIELRFYRHYLQHPYYIATDLRTTWKECIKRLADGYSIDYYVDFAIQNSFGAPFNDKIIEDAILVKEQLEDLAKKMCS